MGHFTPCKGKEYCTWQGERCEGCGRSHVEIKQTRALLDSAGSIVLDNCYDNEQEFADYLAAKLVKIVRYRREQDEEA